MEGSHGRRTYLFGRIGHGVTPRIGTRHGQACVAEDYVRQTVESPNPINGMNNSKAWTSQMNGNRNLMAITMVLKSRSLGAS